MPEIPEPEQPAEHFGDQPDVHQPVETYDDLTIRQRLGGVALTLAVDLPIAGAALSSLVTPNTPGEYTRDFLLALIVTGSTYEAAQHSFGAVTGFGTPPLSRLLWRKRI